ncbi:uncharacterized protein LOC134831416 [Culicoides brevitarsis]|uniref:uncharacterized protein LOC134831416 n=1 Tax=Culicoides brevitarsis TaxID=469753 RepID=UPI00307BBC23
MFDTIFQQCLIHVCLAMCITTCGRLICETDCCLCCILHRREKPYIVTIEHPVDPFKCLVSIKNKSKTKIRRFTIQLHRKNLGFRLTPITAGSVIESRDDFWHRVEIKPQQIFSFELEFVPTTKEKFETKVRCIVCYVNKNYEDRDVQAIVTADENGLKMSKFMKLSDW